MIGILVSLCVAAPPQVTFDPPKPRLGDVLFIYVNDTDVSVERGLVQVLGYEVPLFRVSASQLRGSAPIPIDIKPGEYPVRVVVDAEEAEVKLEVVDRSFVESELRVSKRFTRKKSEALKARLRREARQFQKLWNRPETWPKHVGKLFKPVPGSRTSPFGTKRVFNGVTKSTHYGLDLDGKTGDEIRAAADGQVVLSAMRWMSGGTVVVDHGGGLFTLYFHMSKRLRKNGEWVRQGDLLGLVGKTGRVTGPHLHLAVVVRAMRLSGDRKGEPRSMYVDPEAFLELELKGHPAFVRMPVAEDDLDPEVARKPGKH